MFSTPAGGSPDISFEGWAGCPGRSSARQRADSPPLTIAILAFSQTSICYVSMRSIYEKFEIRCYIRYSRAMAQGRAPAQLWFEYNGEHSVIRLEADSYRVGRVPSNQLSFPGAEGLSREHLAIERAGAHWVARDLGSTNGILVNGDRISEPRILVSGDRITAGRVTLVYRENEEPAAVVFTDEGPAT